MKNNSIFQIFKQGSKTYFYSSVFFPKKVKEDVFILYAFVRTADDYVDCTPQKLDEFFSFKERYQQAIKGIKSNNEIIDKFV